MTLRLSRTILAVAVVGLTTVVGGAFSPSNADADPIITTVPRAHAPFLKGPQAIAVREVEENSVGILVSNEARLQVLSFENGGVEVFAGNGQPCTDLKCGDGGDPKDAQLTRVNSILVIPDDFPVASMRGATLLADLVANRVRMVSRDRTTISTLMGIGGVREADEPDLIDDGTEVHGAPVSAASLALAYGPDGKPDGRLLFLEALRVNVFYEVDFTAEVPKIRRVAGGGSEAIQFDTGQDARSVSLDTPDVDNILGALMPTRDGGFLFGTNGGLLKVKEGKIARVAPFPDANETTIWGLVEDPTPTDDNSINVLVATPERIYRTTFQKAEHLWAGVEFVKHTMIAGPGTTVRDTRVNNLPPAQYGFDGENTLAVGSRLGNLAGMARDSKGTVYFVDSHNALVRAIHEGPTTPAERGSGSSKAHQPQTQEEPSSNSIAVASLKPRKLKPITQKDVIRKATYTRLLLMPEAQGSKETGAALTEIGRASQAESSFKFHLLARNLRGMILRLVEADYRQLWHELLTPQAQVLGGVMVVQPQLPDLENIRQIWTSLKRQQESGKVGWAFDLRDTWPMWRKRIKALNILRQIATAPTIRQIAPDRVIWDNQYRWFLEEVNNWLRELEAE